MKATKHVMMNHAINFLRGKSKTRKKGKLQADIDNVYDSADPTELPAEQSDSIKTPFGGFCNIYSDEFLDIITTQSNIYTN